MPLASTLNWPLSCGRPTRRNDPSRNGRTFWNRRIFGNYECEHGTKLDGVNREVVTECVPAISGVWVDIEITRLQPDADGIIDIACSSPMSSSRSSRRGVHQPTSALDAEAGGAFPLPQPRRLHAEGAVSRWKPELAKGFAMEGMHEALADIPRGGEVLPQERDDDLGGGRPLLGFDAGLLNDLAPKGDLLPDLIEELLWRAARGCGSVIAQVLDCVFAHQQSAHVRV